MRRSEARSQNQAHDHPSGGCASQKLAGRKLLILRRAAKFLEREAETSRIPFGFRLLASGFQRTLTGQHCARRHMPGR
jgi:hypothetical protein